MSSNQFRLDLRKFVEKAKDNSNSVIRKVVLDIGSRLVERSPVGDRELWAINDLTLQNRESYQLFLEDQGKKRVSERTLKKKFKTQGLAGYVGGRFRANWQLQEGSAAQGQLFQKSPPASSYPDASDVVANMDAQITNNPAGKVFFFSNNLPYGQRLEDGWSTQAPSGMVGLTVVEFQDVVMAAVAEVKGSA